MAMIEENEQTAIIMHQHGLVSLTKMFSTKSQKSNSLTQIEELFQILNEEIKNIKTEKHVEERLPIIYKLLNIYTIMEILKKCVENQTKYVIPDKKLIKAFILYREYLQIKNFIENAVWRGDWLDDFILGMKKLKEDKLQTLKKYKTSAADAHGLDILEQIFKNKQEDLNQLSEPETCDVQLMNYHYKKVLYQLYQRATSSARCQKLKLLILYLDSFHRSQFFEISCLIENNKSRICKITEEKGSMFFERYFEEITEGKAEEQKKYLKQLEKSMIESRKLSN